MKTILLNTLNLSSGEIYMIVSGRRIKLSDCTVKVEMYQQETTIPKLGGSAVKKNRVSIVVCNDVDESNCDFENVSRFEISADLLRTDGVYERFFMRELAVDEIEEHGEWRFELRDMDQTKRLFELAL